MKRPRGGNSVWGEEVGRLLLFSGREAGAIPRRRGEAPLLTLWEVTGWGSINLRLPCPARKAGMTPSPPIPVGGGWRNTYDDKWGSSQWEEGRNRRLTSSQAEAIPSPSDHARQREEKAQRPSPSLSQWQWLPLPIPVWRKASLLCIIMSNEKNDSISNDYNSEGGGGRNDDNNGQAGEGWLRKLFLPLPPSLPSDPEKLVVMTTPALTLAQMWQWLRWRETVKACVMTWHEAVGGRPLTLCLREGDSVREPRQWEMVANSGALHEHSPNPISNLPSEMTCVCVTPGNIPSQ